MDGAEQAAQRSVKPGGEVAVEVCPSFSTLVSIPTFVLNARVRVAAARYARFINASGAT
jgi:hypothetical protein